MRRDDSDTFDLSVRYPPYTPIGLSIFRLATRLPAIPSITGLTFSLGCATVGLVSLAAVYLVSIARVIEGNESGASISSFAQKWTK